MHIADHAAYAPTGTRRQAATGPWLIPEVGSRIEPTAAQDENLSTDLRHFLGLLLQAVYSAEGSGRPFLAPLWAEEGMHRAYAMLRLLDQHARRHHGRAKNSLTAGVECALAQSLASAYRSLGTAKEQEMVQCATILRDIVQNLAALFGGGGVVVGTVIERLRLPAYKRRALVLSASELMINALTHAFNRAPHDGRIEVSLCQLDARRARLRVADNGSGLGSSRPNIATGIAGGLAALVEADLTYRRGTDWTTIAEIVFPTEATTSFMNPAWPSRFGRHHANRHSVVMWPMNGRQT